MQAWSKSPTAILRSGDLVNIDVSAELDRYWADTGASVAVGEVAPQHRRLLEATAAAQRDAMGVAGAGRPMRHVQLSHASGHPPSKPVRFVGAVGGTVSVTAGVVTDTALL